MRSENGELRLPFIVSFLLIALFAVFYGRMLPVGSLQHADEYLTLDRSFSFLVRDDWFTVFSSNLPTFKKPPLQYWITAGLIAQGLDLELALRLPSFVFGLALLATVGALAGLVLPSNPWVIPAAIFLLGSSSRFWQAAMSGLLDMGAILFATAALAATLAALRDPRWFYAVAAAATLGALQKAPIPLAFTAAPLLIIGLTKRWHGIELSRILLTKHFLFAIALTAVGVLVWPTLQWLRYGSSSFDEAIIHQVAERFSPFGEAGTGPSWSTKMLAGEPLPRVLGMAAMVWLPWRLARIELLTFPVLVAAYGVAAALATGLVSPRYSLIFVPMMSVSLAAVTLSFNWRPVHSLIAITGLSALSLGPLKSAGSLRLLGDPFARYLPILREISQRIRPDESFIVCGNRGKEGRIPAGAISYYASRTKPMHTIRNAEQLIDQANRGTVHSPYRGLCGEETFNQLRPVLAAPVVESIKEGFVHWTSQGLRP